ncbi:gastrotropin isoform X1 [Panthera leo]|uniref:gastrotropin isoform X1 n=1 Tax=Panthera leo TaxID=9689 RepID=UPI001C69AEBC|nr:gastrotropin isoform X1 [Panthera leo]
MPPYQKSQLSSRMAFSGKYEIESEKNYDEFMKRLGLPSDVIEKGRNFKIVTEVQQDGQNFIWSQHYPSGHSMTNKFTIGKECDMETVGGKKFKATVQMEGGKIVADFPNYHQTSEIVGDKLVEVSVLLVPGIMMRTLFCLQPWTLRAGPLGPGSVSTSRVPGSVLSTRCRSSGFIFRATC